jgi:hypothetical protein
MLRRRWSLREVFRGGLVDRQRVDVRDGVIERFVVTDPATGSTTAADYSAST